MSHTKLHFKTGIGQLVFRHILKFCSTVVTFMLLSSGINASGFKFWLDHLLAMGS